MTVIKLKLETRSAWTVTAVLLPASPDSDIAVVLFERCPEDHTGANKRVWGSFNVETAQFDVPIDTGMPPEELAALIADAVTSHSENDPANARIVRDLKDLFRLSRRFH